MRTVDYYDIAYHVQICLARAGIDKEFQLNLAGVDTENKTPATRGKSIQKLGRGQKTVHQEHIKIDKVLTKEDFA